MPINQIPAFMPVEMPDLAKYRSHLTAISCDRTQPQDTLEAGYFTILFQNTSPGETNQVPQNSQIQLVLPTSNHQRLSAFIGG
ncbi:hypothetical protein [Microcoleus sp. herbarium12]|uniref:hypothetical protein n=1 Tax=Microcoleus sp. herbarium12 TaxID=3055437 RepID=UPI002FD25143